MPGYQTIKAYRSMDENLHTFLDSDKFPASCCVSLSTGIQAWKGLRPEVDVMENSRFPASLQTVQH
jgi:hypothetical protein